jgi:catechol 2,3-dioxygenase-like lactoylglutathione lyase family enzyme
MAFLKKSYVEHVAVRVSDIAWHIRFFKDVLGMSLREVQGPEDAPQQVWTIGGMQLIADPDFNGPEGRLAHLGIMTEDIEQALCEAQAWGVKVMAQGRNWLALPDGLVVELIQAQPNSVAEALAVKARA